MDIGLGGEGGPEAAPLGLGLGLDGRRLLGLDVRGVPVELGRRRRRQELLDVRRAGRQELWVRVAAGLDDQVRVLLDGVDGQEAAAPPPVERLEARVLRRELRRSDAAEPTRRCFAAGVPRARAFQKKKRPRFETVAK